MASKCRLFLQGHDAAGLLTEHLWLPVGKGDQRERSGKESITQKKWCEHGRGPKRNPVSGREIRCLLGKTQRPEGEARSEPASQGISFQKRVCTDLHSLGSEHSEQGVPSKQHPALLQSLLNSRLDAAGLPSSDFPLVTPDLPTKSLETSYSHSPTLQQLSLMCRTWNTVSNNDSAI